MILNMFLRAFQFLEMFPRRTALITSNPEFVFKFLSNPINVFKKKSLVTRDAEFVLKCLAISISVFKN